MSQLPFIPFYVADYALDTQHLSLEEHGAYLRLLFLCWTTPGCSIPADPAWIRRRLSIDEETFDRAVAPVVSEFFRRSRGRVYSSRLKAEFDKAVSAQNGKSRGGTNSAERRKSLKDKQSEPKTLEGNLGDTRAFLEPESESEREEVAAAAGASAGEPSTGRSGLGPDPGDGWTDDDLRDEVMAAVGLQGPGIPTHWMPPAATIHIGRWRRDLGLTGQQIVDGARSRRARHDTPPQGPKALDNTMRDLAAALAAPALTASGPINGARSPAASIDVRAALRSTRKATTP